MPIESENPEADEAHDILRNQRKQVFRNELQADMERLALFDRLVILAEGYLTALEVTVPYHHSIPEVKALVNEALALVGRK